jgi:integrase
MSQALYRRCGCRDDNGRQYGRNCPKLKGDPKHGTWGYYLSHGSEPDPKNPDKLRRRQFRKAGYRTKTAAASAVAELRTRLDKGTYVKPTALTLGEYANAWLPRRERSDRGLRPTTMASYGHYITDDIAPSALGRMKLTDIRRFHVSEFVSDQAKAGRGAETVRKIATLLGTIFASALKDELISTNPARGVEKPKQDRDGVDPWEPDEVRIFLGRCARHRLGALFEVAVLTGLRRGEITGLRWSDVDLVARKIVVRRNRVTVNGRVQEQKNPKTKAGLRTVALSEFAVATLLTWQLRQAQEAENAAEAWRTDGHVFTMEDGRALDPAYITRLFQKLRKGPGEELPAMSFHGLRHCAASLMLASGADIAVVSKLLGHASISITADVYGHLIGTVASDAVNGAANLIARTVHTPEGVDA